jgi:hypothetical protein
VEPGEVKGVELQLRAFYSQTYSQPVTAVCVIPLAIWRHFALREAKVEVVAKVGAEECFRIKKRLFRAVEEHILFKRVLTAISC